MVALGELRADRSFAHDPALEWLIAGTGGARLWNPKSRRQPPSTRGKVTAQRVTQGSWTFDSGDRLWLVTMNIMTMQWRR